MERRRLSNEPQQTSPSKSLLISSNGVPTGQHTRLHTHQKPSEDAELKLLKAELDQLVAQTRDKERKIERLTEENNRLTEDNIELQKESERVQKELEEAKKAESSNSQEHEEEESKAACHS